MSGNLNTIILKSHLSSSTFTVLNDHSHFLGTFRMTDFILVKTFIL